MRRAFCDKYFDKFGAGCTQLDDILYSIDKGNHCGYNVGGESIIHMEELRFKLNPRTNLSHSLTFFLSGSTHGKRESVVEFIKRAWLHDA